jgi:hypothetical protein
MMAWRCGVLGFFGVHRYGPEVCQTTFYECINNFQLSFNDFPFNRVVLSLIWLARGPDVMHDGRLEVNTTRFQCVRKNPYDSKYSLRNLIQP